MSEKKRAPFREIFGWAMFDFANSSYTTVIITVAFSVVFPKLIVGDEKSGNLLWCYALPVFVSLHGSVYSYHAVFGFVPMYCSAKCACV